MEPTDNALMLAVKAGNPEQFGVLFDRHHQRLFDFFYRLSGDAASSDDLVQEVFLRMFKYRRTFRIDSEFRAWMYQIARTARIDRFKAQRNETQMADTWAEDHADPQSMRSFEDQARTSLLQRALLQLPEEKRELLVLARFQELKYEQIGTLLNVDAGTVKVRVHRAMLDLRAIIQAMSGEKAKCDVKKSGKLLRTT